MAIPEFDRIAERSRFENKRAVLGQVGEVAVEEWTEMAILRMRVPLVGDLPSSEARRLQLLSSIPPYLGGGRGLLTGPPGFHAWNLAAQMTFLTLRDARHFSVGGTEV